MTDEETEVWTGETIAQGHLTNRGEAGTEATRTSTFSLGVLVSSSASKGTVPVATTTTLPTWAMAPGYKPPFLFWTLSEATESALRCKTTQGLEDRTSSLGTCTHKVKWKV